MGSLSRPIGEDRAESGKACPGPDPGSGPLRVAIGVKRQLTRHLIPLEFAEKGGYSSYTRCRFWKPFGRGRGSGGLVQRPFFGGPGFKPMGSPSNR